MVDRNLGYKLIDVMMSSAKVVTMIDFNNMRVEIEQMIISLNSINMKSKAQLIYILPDLLNFLSLFLNGELVKVNDIAFFSRYAYINTKQIRTILKKYEVF
jgi:hypothetical protein